METHVEVVGSKCNWFLKKKYEKIFMAVKVRNGSAVKVLLWKSGCESSAVKSRAPHSNFQGIVYVPELMPRRPINATQKRQKISLQKWIFWLRIFTGFTTFARYITAPRPILGKGWDCPTATVTRTRDGKIFVKNAIKKCRALPGPFENPKNVVF